MDRLYTLCRWMLGGIFIYAGATKLLEPGIFAGMIEAYGIVPDVLLLPVAFLLPVLEVIAGIGLLFDIRGSLALITGLLVLFMAVLGYGIWMGLDVDCGCFAPEDPEAKVFHGLRLSLYRDLVMLVGIGFMYRWRRFRAIRPFGIMAIVKKTVTKGSKENADVAFNVENGAGLLPGGRAGRSGRSLS